MSQANLQAAIQEEQNRLYRFLHDRMSPKIMEVAFLVENLAADLETTQLDAAAKEVEKIRQLLGEVFDEMPLLFRTAYGADNSVGAPGAASRTAP
jgi:signal transduction histidine kinase